MNSEADIDPACSRSTGEAWAERPGPEGQERT
jgi:hypothetical protein